LETRPPIVCLCGSTRYARELRAANRELTLAGAIVLAPAEFERAGPEPVERVEPAGPGRPGRLKHPGDQTAGTQITDGQKAALAALHLAKIDLADRVLVVNPGGYVGESTRREIHYAHQTGKPVEYTDPPGSALDA
jgi:hypothetical protein